MQLTIHRAGGCRHRTRLINWRRHRCCHRRRRRRRRWVRVRWRWAWAWISVGWRWAWAWISVGWRWAWAWISVGGTGLVGDDRIRARIWVRWGKAGVGEGHRRRRGRRRVARVAGAFVGLLEAVTEKLKSHYKAKNHQHRHNEDEDLCSFTHITHFFFFFFFFPKDLRLENSESEMGMFLILLLAKLRWVLRQVGLFFVSFSWRCGGAEDEGERE
jgi:hypothetical protein